MRFADVRSWVKGTREKVLLQQLRKLVVAGVIVRHDHRQLSPMVGYALLPFSQTLSSTHRLPSKGGNEAITIASTAARWVTNLQGSPMFSQVSPT